MTNCHRQSFPQRHAVPLFWCLSLFFASSSASEPASDYLHFDGVDDQVVAGDIDPQGGITLEAWIRPESISDNKSQNRVISKSSDYELTISTGDTGCSFGTTGDVQWRATIGGANARICGGQLQLSLWHHIAGTYDGSTFTLYVNGSPVATTARSGTITANDIPLAVGNHPVIARPFHGGIDEARIWGRALSQAEVLNYMNIELSGSESGLQAYYRFDEGSGQVAFDGSPGGFDATLGTTAGTDAQDPLWVSQDPTNQAPVVDAGPAQTLVLPNVTAVLDGTVSDDGLPGGTLTVNWGVVSGPAPVTFADPNAEDTTAAFSVEGDYVLRLTAFDGELSTSSDVLVRVTPELVLSSIEIIPAAATVVAGGTFQFTARGFDPSGNPTSIAPLWNATGGTISQTGLYTAGTNPGQYTVTAGFGGVQGQVAVSVFDPNTVWPTAGWSSATPGEMGMDQNQLMQARDYALTAGGSGYITRSGRLVMAWGDDGLRYDLKSSTKSIGATILGLALKDGLVDVEDAAQLHLSSVGIPPQSNAATGWLDDIRLVDLATHTAGFDKPGGYIDLLFQPFTRWRYSDGGFNWLADVLTTVYAEDLRTVLFSRVLTRLGITNQDLTWRDNQYRDDLIDGIKRREFGSGIHANVDAMARIGYLYLRSGMWEAENLLPASFIDRVAQPATGVAALPVDEPVEFPDAAQHYGMAWWTNLDGTLSGVPAGTYWSWGLYESLIVVMPELDIVAVRAGTAGWRPGWDGNYSFLAPFIAPIAQSVINNPLNLPPDTDAGTNLTTTLPVDTVNLDGTVTDDGLPNAALVTTWSVISGPGSVAFGNAGMVDTTAAFSAAGTYVLSLKGDDGVLYTSDQVTVTVEPEPDTTPPVVAITSPAEGAAVFGIITLSAQASDNDAVNSVEFRVDGLTVGSAVAEPYVLVWDTAAVGDGPHVVEAIATDASGNTAGDSVTVTAFNQDTDGDGLSDNFEQSIGTHILLTDTDGDGLSDYEEVAFDGDSANYTPGQDPDPLSGDTDDDGVSDGLEVQLQTDPLDAGSFPSLADGDINMDGQVNAADVLLGYRVLAGDLNLTEEQQLHGDVAPLVAGVPAPNRLFDLGDLLVIQRKALGLANF